MNDTRTLVLDAAATYRLARLVTTDTFPPVKAVRDAFVERHENVEVNEQGQHFHKPDSWAELVQCPWCAGFWIAAAVLLARRFAPRLWDPIAKAMALSAAAGMLSVHDE